ncbi:MAG: PAS domain-containing protein [Alphaproteobacteria bacterium]|nr:PAS domain-containing protein [Alphaproteobacteria bacterium]
MLCTRIPRPPDFATWHPKVQAAFDYWTEIQPGSGLAGRQHIDPARIVPLLPNVYLLDVLRGARLDYRYRIFGTELVNRVGRDLTGRRLSEIGLPTEIEQVLARLVEHGGYDWRRGPPINPALPKYLTLERIALPLARDGSTVDMLFGVSVFVSAE